MVNTPFFSLYMNGIKNVYPAREISIIDFIELIKQDNPLVIKARTLSDKKERDAIKSKMSYVTFGGTFLSRSKKNLIRSSGLACFDIDNLKDLEPLKRQLIVDKYVHLLFISPSGNGLKVVVKIPIVQSDLEYKEYWRSISQHFNLPEQDESCKDISRACYLSVDKEPYFNPDSEVYTDRVLEEVKQKQINHNNKKKNTKVNKKTKYDYTSNPFLDKLKSSISMEEVLREFGVDTSVNPTDCPFHYCSQRCLSFNSDVAHCFDDDCVEGDNSWNIFSFVKKARNVDSAEAIKLLVDLAGLQEEYEKSKKEYFEKIEETEQPKGWGKVLNIQEIAAKYNFTKCPSCNNNYNFNAKMGWFSCESCSVYGGLKKFLTYYHLNKSQEVTA
jgi:hypothetical protein